MKRKIVWFVLLAFMISGCAAWRYDAYKDPVYQAYLNGEISYADYVNHYHQLMAGRRAVGAAVSAGFHDAAQSLKPKPSYTVKDEFGIPIGSIEEE